MTKIKALLLVALVAVMLLLTGCGVINGDNHIHDLKWVNGENPKFAFQFCTECLRKLDCEDRYSEPVVAVSSTPGGCGDPGYSSEVGFEANIEKGIFEYNEEFDINLKVSIWPDFIEDGPFQIKLTESPYYEIVGESEFTVTNFVTKSFGEYVMNFTFRVKAIGPCSCPESFDFKVKFNPTEKFLQRVSGYPSDSIWYYNPSEEYFFGFKQLEFINDSQGMLIADYYEYDKHPFYDSVNREYLAGVLSKDDYIDRFYECYLNDSVYVDFERYTSYSDSKGFFAYYSKNIRAEFHLKSNYEYFLSLYNNTENALESRVELKKGLVKILLDEGYISNEEYKREIGYIEERKSGKGFIYFSHDLMAIEKYFEENKIDYVYEEKDSKANNESLDGSEGNVASLYLS